LRVKLRHLDAWNARRVEVADRYQHWLRNIPGLTLPAVPEWAEPVWHLYIVRCVRRDELQRLLSGSGIGSLVHYPVPPHLSGAYRDGRWKGARPVVAEQFARECLSLPIGPHLSQDDAERVAAVVSRFAQPVRLAA